MSMKRCLAATLAAGVIFLTGCAAKMPRTNVEPETVGKVTEDEVGLLGFEEPNPDAFTVAILPDADGNIYEITMEYALGDDWEGQQSMVTEDGGSFGRENVILKTFSAEELGNGTESIPPLTLAMMFTDSQGHETAALNTYTIDSPQYEGEYLLKITGNEEQGYHITDR